MNNFVSLCVYALIALAVVACSDEPKHTTPAPAPSSTPVVPATPSPTSTP